MTPQERAEKIVEGFSKNISYQGVQDYCGIKKGVMWAAVVKLCESGKLKKTGMGKYTVVPEAPMPIFARKEYTRRSKNVLPFQQKPIPPVAVPEPPPAPPKREDDVEEVATDLLDKIGTLQPLLLLHKEIFVGIEASTMKLVELIVNLKPRILTSEQLAEYEELRSFKERAMRLAAQRQYKQK